jgi:hypothetical protein
MLFFILIIKFGSKLQDLSLNYSAGVVFMTSYIVLDFHMHAFFILIICMLAPYNNCIVLTHTYICPLLLEFKTDSSIKPRDVHYALQF